MHPAQGKTRTTRDLMDPARAAALHATLALAGAPPGPGDPLPPFFHQAHFWDARPPADLGRDGHPAIGDFIPDLGLPRRMWAGGRLAFHAPLRAGIPADRTTTIQAVSQKQGRTGPLAFVTLRHDIAQNGQLCVTEHQDLVYRQDPAAGAPRPAPPQAPAEGAEETPLAFSPTLLFRYSALTFNGHRIHYDRDYARGVEGYAGLVVHGPLLAQLMMLHAARRGPLTGFTFRAHAPMMDTEPATLCAAGPRLWIRGPDNRLCMMAEAIH
ncbi:FAS1-like dehydratase domain-containing protein [Rhodovulum adriaticum]|uniref:3-methylfumaryl-CoA hydratase n=1 Tax=Rhodovulum adriaticum TaxID=35804 RepID=A0A4R2NYW1_RHOAD|nr:MaoC family dehydratase N-terminal domain-containing protein [Rhodovulum adriaticum]MBK1634959.1 acyl dehydratase [Rhodovulum adriaticum]TCP27430.1 3-methylfumaryl-CoA hydratase [Rhodovulum adriaticum]